MNVSDAGRAKIIEREGVRLYAYKDTRGIPTIGIGNTTYPDGRAVTMADPPITRAQADAMFRATLDRFALGVSDALTRVPSQAQFDAMCSFAYNIGVGGFRSSTMLKKFNAGDIQGAADAMLLWDKPPEIVDRRKGERLQFLAGSDVSMPAPAPVGEPTSKPPLQVATPAAPPKGPWETLFDFFFALFFKRRP